MCMNCGCGQPNERHGNQANIVADDLRRAGEANGQDLATTVRNVRAAMADLDRSSPREPETSKAGGGRPTRS